MEFIRARHRGERHVYVHNDLLNAAHNLKELIERRLEVDDRKGIAFSYLSCMIMLAFSLEAAINFLGFKLIENWNEFERFNRKLDQILDTLKLTPDRTTRPYRSIAILKELRDSLAHGKPIIEEFDEIVEAPRDEIERMVDLDHGWEAYCAHDAVMEACEDVDEIWKQLRDASGLEDFDTMTHGTSTLTYIGSVERPEAR